jgi:broad specificity phosphatase PhoE
MNLLLIRHAQSLANIGVSDDADCDLSAAGAAQARAMAEQMRGLDLRSHRGIASPYLRARRTAAIIADATGVSFRVDPGCREWGKTCQLGDLIYEEETLPQVVERLAAFLNSLDRGADYVIVSHATPIFQMKQLASGASPSDAAAACVGEFWNVIENCVPHRVQMGASE